MTKINFATTSLVCNILLSTICTHATEPTKQSKLTNLHTQEFTVTKEVFKKNIMLDQLESEVYVSAPNVLKQIRTYRLVNRELNKFFKENKRAKNIITIAIARSLSQYKKFEFPLHSAIMRKDLPAIKLLIHMGKDVNEKNLFKATPLYYAIQMHDFPQVAQLLVDNGADISGNHYSSETLLHIALMHKKTAMINWLLSQENIRTIINTQDEDGDTPIYYAVMQQNVKAIALLIQKGALPNITNNKGISSFDQANMHIKTLITMCRALKEKTYNDNLETYTFLKTILTHDDYINGCLDMYMSKISHPKVWEKSALIMLEYYANNKNKQVRLVIENIIDTFVKHDISLGLIKEKTCSLGMELVKN